MKSTLQSSARRAAWSLLALTLAACGGGGGNERDSGVQQTTLSVAASDADGDALRYEWRATAGTIDNRNSSQTTWTLPDGPGLHFAYVSVSDGKGGYALHQYAVSSDDTGLRAPERAQARHTPPTPAGGDGNAVRLRFSWPDPAAFAGPAPATPQAREVYLPDLPVNVVHIASGDVVFAGTTDSSGEVSLPKLVNGDAYRVSCAPGPGQALAFCRNFTLGGGALRALNAQPVLPAGANLRLFGHVGFADGGVCGTQSEYFRQFSSATVQLLDADGAALTPPRRVNRFGDYALEAAVPVRASLRLRIDCEGVSNTIDVPPSAQAAGYTASGPVELSHQIANNRPVVSRMVANGPDGNLRGREIITEPGSASNTLPGEERFLSYKGLDTRLGACKYYRSFGMVRDCDAQGGMIDPVTIDEWKREHELPPYASAGAQAAADYINKMDLNLVRRMTAAAKSRDSIAFLVCNHPGPDGQSQREVDEVMATALRGERLVACVGMEWSATAGVNGGQPFTKFVTFGPDGALLPSINLDGRGEKYLPGSCVACHGGSAHSGRFPETGNPSPYLGSRFLPFDTGNYFFASPAGFGETAQSENIKRLNEFVSSTESLDDNESTATRRLVQGWYRDGRTMLDREYVPPNWAMSSAPGAATFYREVVGASCRTCHTALGSDFDWDTTVLTPARAKDHVCGGSAQLAINASMPNALITRDRIAERTQADPALAELMRSFLGCDAPLPDPAYPTR